MTKEEPFILFSDIKALFFRSLKFVLLGALVFGGIGFWARTQLPVKYEIHATFKDGGKTTLSQVGLFENLLKNMSLGGDKQGDVLMTSSLILEPVIEALGLQGKVESQAAWQQRKKRFFEALLAENRKPLQAKTSFALENISYSAPFPQQYHLFFLTKGTFEVRDQTKRLLAQGNIGEKLVFDQSALTLKEVPDDLKLHTSYSLTLYPLEEVMLQLKEEIKVIENSVTPGIFDLTLFHSDLSFGKRLLNAVMEEYQNYLQRENERVSKQHMAYLENRRDELCTKMNEDLHSHVVYLKQNLHNKGTLTLSQHLPLFEQKKELLSKDLFALQRKKGALKQGESGDLGQEMGTLQAHLHQMMKEKDALSLALLDKMPLEQTKIATHLHQLDLIEKEKLRAQTGIDTFFGNLLNPLQEEQRLFLNRAIDITRPIPFPELRELKQIEAGKKKLIALIKRAPSSHLNKTYLDTHLRLLSLKEEVLKKRLLFGTSHKEEYEGLDKQTARSLLLDFLHKRDLLLSTYRQMEFGRQELQKEKIEPISLTQIFSDPISQSLARELGELTQSLRKKRTLTEKEEERLEKTFLSKKEDLLCHMNKTMELTLLEKESVDEKIHSLQEVTLDLIGQEIAVIEKQIKERIDEKLKYLEQEKGSIQNELAHLKREMEDIPDQWLREKKLAFSAEMNQGMLEALVQLVESKRIENHLSIIESKPIGAAYASFIPKSPLLKIFGVVGAFIGGLIAFACCFMRDLHRGFPIGLRNLKMRGKNVVGRLKKDPQKELEVLRRLSLLLQKKETLPLIVTFVLGKKDYDISSFAFLLAKEGKRLLLFTLNFSKLSPSAEGEFFEPPLRQESFGDCLFFEGDSLYSQELLKSQRFTQFLEEMKQTYDVILLSLNLDAKKTLPKYLLTKSDAAVIRLNEESLSDLIPYFEWEDEKHTLAFLR